jgi:hypothetical protein
MFAGRCTGSRPYRLSRLRRALRKSFSQLGLMVLDPVGRAGTPVAAAKVAIV